MSGTPTPTYHTSTDRRVNQSEIERTIVAALVGRGVPIVESVKLGNNWVFDGAINGTRILVEIHGDYWHQRAEVAARDQRKQDWAERNDYQIVTIWERDYHADPEAQLQRVIAAHAAAQAAPPTLPTKDPALPRKSTYGDWRDLFLASLRETGIVGAAARAAGVDRRTVATHRKDDDAFDEACKDARRDAADLLRAEYRKRAMEQSDRAMEYMIRQIDPDDADARGPLALLLPYVDLSRLSDSQIAQLSAGEDPIKVILGGG
jgi:very-short-patch-repair endonuclease